MFEPDRNDRGDESWTELTDELLALTNKLRTTYRRVADESGPTEEEIRRALGTLAGAWSQLAGSVSEAVADPEVRAHLRRAGGSFVSAVTAGLGELASRPESNRDQAEEE
jgi:hypothetical protein